MRTILITDWEKTIRLTFITKSLKKAINITKILFQDIENLPVQQIDARVVKFPTKMAGSKLIPYIKTKP
jgi:hypothetical protein